MDRNTSFHLKHISEVRELPQTCSTSALWIQALNQNGGELVMFGEEYSPLHGFPSKEQEENFIVLL